jgi:hypothetical protein
LSYGQLIEWFLIEDKTHPVVSEIASCFKQKALSIQAGDVECIASTKWLNIYWPADEFIFIKLCTENSLTKFYQEAKDIITINLQRLNLTISKSLLNDIFVSNSELIKQPFIKDNKEMVLSHNLLEFYQAALVSKETSLKSGIFKYEIVRNKSKWESWPDWCQEVVWFGTKKGDYLYPFLINKENVYLEKSANV